MVDGNFIQLTIAKTESLIGGDAQSVYFALPDSVKHHFQWLPGQHITVQFNIKGEEHRRAYSISSPPHSDEHLRITVKRQINGLVSNYINDQLKAGDVVAVMPPFGGFTLVPDAAKRRTHYFIGAGSGITPLFSMLSAVLLAEPHSSCHLLYGNNNEKNTLLLNELSQYSQRYSERFSVSHVFSKPSMWSSFKYWKSGRIEHQFIAEFIRENQPYAQDTQYYICGPGLMNNAVKDSLQQLDVPAQRIHDENFVGATQDDQGIKSRDAHVVVHISQQTHELNVIAGQTLLAALKGKGIKSPYACQAGVCGACTCTLSKGKVHMRSRAALTDRDIQQGKILACQSMPLTDHLELKYQ